MPATVAGPLTRRAPEIRRWWLDRSVRAKGLTVIAIPMIAMLCIISLSLALGSKERQERSRGTIDRNLSTAATQLLFDAINGESGIRGYGSTRNALFLAPYNLALGRLAGDRSTLKTAAGAEGSQPQQKTVDATAASVFAELAQLKSSISAGISTPSLTLALEHQKITMDLLRAQVAALSDGPTASSVAERKTITGLETKINLLDLVSFFIALVAGLSGVALFSSGISRRLVAAAANADRLGRGELLEPVNSSRDELGRLADSLVRAETLLATRAVELTTARDDAVKATDAKNAFLSHTSHELRTPLNSVLGFAQLIQMSPDLSAEDRDSSARILSAGRHLLALINELIDIARIESGDLNLSLESVSVLPLVEEASRLLAPIAAERSIEITYHCANTTLAVNADQQRLSQVLVNLISNAVKYNHRNGAITITCQEEGPDEASIAIFDTGPGLAHHDLERVFIPFDRLDAAQTGIEGTGIGLPLSKALTEAMGGRLTAQSTLGQGSVFTVTIPRAPDAIPALAYDVEPSQQRTLPATAGKILNILYIEDNPANVEVISRYLKGRPNARLTAVASGRSGIAFATQNVPDIILLDLHLSDLHGEQVIDELRTDAITAAIPVVVLSADASPGVIRRLLARGALTYLTKPIDLAELGDLLDSTETAPHNLPHSTMGTKPS